MVLRDDRPASEPAGTVDGSIITHGAADSARSASHGHADGWALPPLPEFRPLLTIGRMVPPEVRSNPGVFDETAHDETALDETALDEAALDEAVTAQAPGGEGHGPQTAPPPPGPPVGHPATLPRQTRSEVSVTGYPKNVGPRSESAPEPFPGATAPIERAPADTGNLPRDAVDPDATVVVPHDIATGGRRHRRRRAEHPTVAAVDRRTDVRGRVLLVGATGRIGSSIAQLLAKAGFQLVLNDIGAQDDLEELAGSLPGGPHVPLSADVTDAAAVEDLLALADAAFDGIDVVVMALRSPRQPTSDADLELWTDTASMRLSVEVLGPAIVAQAAVRAFAARNITGRLIMVASPSQGSAMDATVGAALSGLGAGLAADHSRQVGVCLVRSSVPPDELAATVGWLVEHPSGIGVGVLHTVGA